MKLSKDLPVYVGGETDQPITPLYPTFDRRLHCDGFVTKLTCSDSQGGVGVLFLLQF